MATETIFQKIKNRIPYFAAPTNGNGKRPAPFMEVYAPTSADIYNKFIVSPDWMLNPDQIVAKESAGLNIEIYDEMEAKDPNLYGLMQVRKSSVAHLPWKVLPYSEEARDEEVAEFCTDVLKNIRDFTEDLYELLDGVAKGFSVSEIIWYIRPDGKWGVYWLESRRQRRFQFSPDGKLLLQTARNIMPGDPVPPRKFLVLRHGAKGENPYGDGVLKHCYWYYLSKKVGMKFWAVYLERYGQPGLDIKATTTASADVRKRMDEIAEKWQQSTAITHGDDIEITLLEAAKSGTTSYDGFMEFCNKEISKAILGQATVTDPGLPGTQASPRISNFVRRDLIQQDATTLSSVIEELLRWVVDFNYGPDVPAPHFALESEPEEDLNDAVVRDEKLAKLGLPMALDYLYSKYKVAVPEDGQELLEIPEPEPFGQATPQEETQEAPSLRRKRSTILLRQFKKPKRAARYDIASVARGRRRFADELRFFFREMEEPLKQALSGNLPVQSAVEDFIAERFPQRLAGIVKEGNLQALRTAAFSMAKRLNTSFNENRFLDLAAKYAQKHAYELGAAQEMTKTIREIMGNRAGDLADSGLTIEQIRDDLLASFDDLAKSRAEMIAVTETQKAANWAATEMARNSGLPLEAYFVGESTDEPLCLDLLSGNPYKLSAAEVGEIPHPNCQHNWVFARTEENA